MAFEDEELKKRREARAREQSFMQQQKKLLRIGMIATAATLAICGIALLITVLSVGRPQQPSMETPPSDETVQNQPETPQPETPQPETPPVQPDTVVHFVAGGDVNITDKTVAAGADSAGYRYTDVFMDLVPVLAGADLASVNFEGGLYGAPYGGAGKSAPIQLAQALREAGVDFVQTANSQSVVGGLDGLRATLQSVRDAGMTPLGTYANSDEFKQSKGYVIRQVKGIRIAVVAFTKGMDGMGLPAGSEDCVNLLYKDYNSTYQKVDTEGITAVLQAAQAQKPDITIALLHWGSEYNSKVSKTQEQIIKLMQEQGVDAIIGTHSHYVQQAEFDGDKGTLVAYGLGDLYGDGTSVGTNYSVLLDLQITKSAQTGQVKLTGFSYTPVFLQDETETGGTLRLLRIPEAMAAYEQNSVSKVSDATYTQMKAALEKVQQRMSPQG